MTTNSNRPLREIMLDVHETQVKRIFDIPLESKVNYNEESTQICVDGVPIYDFLGTKLFDESYTLEIMKLRREIRCNLVKAHSNPEKISSNELFHLQFDYELLALDHLVSSSMVKSIASNLEKGVDKCLADSLFLTPSTGRSFFEEVYIKELESLGYQLKQINHNVTEKGFYFENKGFSHFVRHTMTRDKLIKIILDHDSVVERLQNRYDNLRAYYPSFESPSEVYDVIKELRIEQMRRRSTWENLVSKLPTTEQKYLRFVGEALDFNEDNRLMRSISFYHIMQDKSISRRFYDLIEARKDGNR